MNIIYTLYTIVKKGNLGFLKPGLKVSDPLGHRYDLLADESLKNYNNQ